MVGRFKATVLVTAELVRETDSAYLIRTDGGEEVWLPQSEVEYDGIDTFEISTWLAKERGLA